MVTRDTACQRMVVRIRTSKGKAASDTDQGMVARNTACQRIVGRDITARKW
jgi:hypothetical protein